MWRKNLGKTMLCSVLAGCSSDPSGRTTGDNRDAADKVTDFLAGVRAGFESGRLNATVVPDRSLPVEQYVALGVPPMDQPWSSSDLSVAARVLAQLAEDKGDQLPRFASAKSGEVFARLSQADEGSRVPQENLSSAKQMAELGPEYMERLQAVNRLLELYRRAYERQQVGITEVIELAATASRVTALLLPIFGRVFSAIDPDDPRYPAARSGWEQALGGVSKILRGSIMTLSEPHAPDAKLRLLAHMRRTAPELLRLLPDPEQARLLEELRSLVPQLQHPEVHRGLSDLVELLGPVEPE